MPKQRLTHRLPQPRVSEKLFNLVHKVAVAQELDVADVIRLALEDYCAPVNDVVNVPVVGEIKDNKVIFYPYVRIEGVPVKTMLDNAAKEQSRYLEVEPVG